MIDGFLIKRKLIVVLAFILTVIIAGLTLSTGNRIFMVGFVALPFVLMLMLRPAITFVLAFILDATAMSIPGVSYTTLGLLSKFIAIVAATLAFLILPRKRSSNNLPESALLKWFALIIIILMVFRGAGLRMLGSDTWGGMLYIVLFCGIAFFFAVQSVRLNRRHIKWLIWGMMFFGVIGSITSKLGWEVETAGASENTRARLQWLRPFVLAAFPLVFALRWKLWLKVLLWFSLIGLMGLTGFRSLLVGLIMITAIYGFFITRSRIRYGLFLIISGVVLWGIIIVSSPYFPRGLQRATSFIPGATIDRMAEKDAAGSIEWRVEIWKYCLEQSRNYLLIGRGSTFDVYSTAAGLGVKDIATYSPWFAYETRSYHSGPLSLLIDYGIPGLIVITWFMILLFRRFWRYAIILGKQRSLESRFTLYWSSYMLWHLVAFYLVYGSMVVVANRILSMSALTIVLFNSLEQLRKDESAESSFKILEESNV